MSQTTNCVLSITHEGETYLTFPAGVPAPSFPLFQIGQEVTIPYSRRMGIISGISFQVDTRIIYVVTGDDERGENFHEAVPVVNGTPEWQYTIVYEGDETSLYGTMGETELKKAQ